MKTPKSILCAAFVLALVAVLVFASGVHAQEPIPPASVIAIQCTGLGRTDGARVLQQYETAWGWSHQLTTSDDWKSTYNDRIDEFLHAFGCPSAIDLDSQNLTTWGRARRDLLRGVIE